MSQVEEKESVIRTTRVRTKLRGDNSWLQRSNDAETDTKKEKPWLAEVRAGRLNGPTAVETSPVTSPTKSTPSPTKSGAERTSQSGYIIRGVFTKLDKPVSSSTTNGVSGTTTQFTKKPSETYKKIAPYTVKTTGDNQDSHLSTEDQEKRTAAASSVLKKTAVRQRSYVLSAAKKFETPETVPDTSVVKSSPGFVARRVEISDEDESGGTPAPASSPPPVSPVTSVASMPEPKLQEIFDTSVKTIVDVTVNEPVAPKVEREEEKEAAPEPAEDDLPAVSFTATDTAEDDLPAVSVAVKDPFEDKIPGCTKVDTPLPVLLPEFIQAVHTEPEPEDSDFSGQFGVTLVEVTPLSPTPVSPTPAAPASPVPLSPVPVSAVTEITVRTEPEPEPEIPPKQRSDVDTLGALSDTLISFGTSSPSIKDDEPVLAEEEGSSAADTLTTEDGAEEEPVPELSDCIPMTDDLLALTGGPEVSAEPVPPSPGRWSQDLLGGLDSESNPAKTSGALDFLAGDVIPINTEARSLSVQLEEEEKPTHETVKETQSLTETVTITTETVIITDKSQEDITNPWSSQSHVTTTTVTESSSADPFDPYPIGTTSSNSSSDLLQPLSDISINSASTTFMENKDPSPAPNNALESLADDVIPINTDTTSLSSHRSWTRTWETSPTQQEDTAQSQEAPAGGQTVDQQTMIMFERKSKENDSPWDRWTSPTVYTITSTTGEEEEEEEESPGYTQTQTETVTTITTIREIHSDPQPAMDRYETYSRTVTEEDQRVQTPEPEAKKGFVYVKEYVNATDLINSGSDYLTSSSSSYSYSSPSSYSSSQLSSSCNFCGELVGNDAKITIEHLNINCHPTCFKCGVCSKPMGDLLDSMFLHGGKVHCETCYSKALD